jgi:hypothetical protein
VSALARHICGGSGATPAPHWRFSGGETLPHLARVALLLEARGDPAAVRQMERAAQALGLTLQVLTVRAPDKFPRAFQAAI